jgi:hypothetical protein
MDKPVVSEKPIGPGKTTIAGGCTIAGLMFGIGLVFVLSPNDRGKSFGRRITDMGRRRQEDQVAAPSTSTLAASKESGISASKDALGEIAPIDVPEIKTKSMPAERLERTLGVADARRERPAPIMYDEKNLAIKQRSSTTAESSTTESDPHEFAKAAAAVEHTKPQEQVAANVPGADEHPKDSSFRDFLMTELQKTEDRRQQPRAAQPKPATASLGLRTPPGNKPTK